VNATFLDTITNTFVDAIQTGIGTLQSTYSLGLLLILATIAFYARLGPLLAHGSAGVGESLAQTLLTLITTGVFYFLLFHLPTLATAAFDTFLLWGLAPAGGVSAASFRQPSGIVDTGFRIAKPLLDFGSSFKWYAPNFYWFTLWNYSAAYWLIVIAFFFVALHLMMTIIEYNLAVMAGTVLIPWGVLAPTAFFSEFSIGWITGGLVRVLVTVAMLGIAQPLFDGVTPNMTGGGDPTWYSSAVMAVSAAVFAILSWVIPSRAAAIAGRGISLAIHGGTVLAGGGAVVAAAAGPLRGVLLVQQAIRGVSQLLGM